MNKGLQFIVVLGVLFICLSPCAYSQLRRSMRQIPIGNSDYQGYARMDKIFYRMPLGDGRFADFFFKFTSDPSLEPKYMGLYWTIPFFDTQKISFDFCEEVVQIRYHIMVSRSNSLE